MTHRPPPQPDALFDVDDIPTITLRDKLAATDAPRPVNIEERFEQFHEDNPWVYDRLAILALDLVRNGHRRIGMKQLWEVLRWQYSRATISDDGLKLNNDYTSRYARLLAATEPELADAFETRRIRTP